MPIPQVTDRLKEAPAVVLRAVFAGIGQLLMAADKIRAQMQEQAASAPAGQKGPGDAQAARRPADEASKASNGTRLHERPASAARGAAARTGASETWPAAAATASAAKQATGAEATATKAPAPKTAAPKTAAPTPAAATTAAPKTAAPETAAPTPAAAKTAAPKTAGTKPAELKATAAKAAAPKTAAPKAEPSKTAASKATAPGPAAAGGRRSAPEPAAPKPATPAPLAAQAAPIPGYDDLSIASLRARLRGLDAADVQALLAYEKANAHRDDVITMFERRISKIGNGTS